MESKPRLHGRHVKALNGQHWTGPLYLMRSSPPLKYRYNGPSQGQPALIVTRLHHSVTGIGFAGASRPDFRDSSPPQVSIDLRKLRACLPEWQRLCHINLTAMEKEHQCRDHPPGSLETLKEAELITSCLAQAMAPTRIR